MKKAAWAFIALFVAFGVAQEKQKQPAFTDKLGAKLALAQRDYVVANSQRDTAVANLQAVLKEAETACTSDGKVLDGQKAECVEKPAPPEAKAPVKK